MKLTLDAKYGNDEGQQHYATTERYTFQALGKTWRIENVMVTPRRVWISVARQTNSGRDYVRGNGRAFQMADLPAELVSEIKVALAQVADEAERQDAPSTACTAVVGDTTATNRGGDPIPPMICGHEIGADGECPGAVLHTADPKLLAGQPGPSPVRQPKLADFRHGIGAAQRDVTIEVRRALGRELAIANGLTEKQGERLIEAACTGLPLVITWTKPHAEERGFRSTATVLVQFVFGNRVFVAHWGLEHPIYLADIESVELPRTSLEVVEATPVADEPEQAESTPECDPAQSDRACGAWVRYVRAGRVAARFFETARAREQWIEQKGEWINVLERQDVGAPLGEQGLRANSTMSAPQLTEESKALFLAYAADAGNWGGTPLVGGNVGGDRRAQRGNLTQLKLQGLITTQFDERADVWLHFTTKGREFAEANGVPVS